VRYNNCMQQGLVIAEYKSHYDVVVDDMVYTASVRGHFHTRPTQQFPKVGDQVMVITQDDDQAVIEEVLPRRNEIARYNERVGEEQVMVTNIDYLIIVMGLDNDFNLPRLQRYLALASQSGVAPVVVLNKVDVVDDETTVREAVRAVAGDVPVHFVSALTGAGAPALQSYLAVGTTAVLLGSSGAGKSTLLNQLVRDAAQPTQSVRERDARGKHTTTHRQLFQAAAGGFIIDTPGMRELALLDDEAAAEEQFQDIADLAGQCQFRNCDHDKSAGCAILAALEAGTVDPKRVKQYFKLLRSEERLRRRR
jgi:ribosome biogenesis GTPase